MGELCGVLPPHGSMAEGLLNAQQLLVLGSCALLESAYFGLAVGYLDAERGPSGPFRLVMLPRQAPSLVFPLAAVVGGACGMKVERLRQAHDETYVKGLEMQILGATHGDEAEVATLIGTGALQEKES